MRLMNFKFTGLDNFLPLSLYKSINLYRYTIILKNFISKPLKING